MKNNTQNQISPALSRGLRVLELLAQEESELSLKSISESLSIPTPSLWRILCVLRDNGYLLFDKNKKHTALALNFSILATFC